MTTGYVMSSFSVNQIKKRSQANLMHVLISFSFEIGEPHGARGSLAAYQGLGLGVCITMRNLIQSKPKAVANIVITPTEICFVAKPAPIPARSTHVMNDAPASSGR